MMRFNWLLPILFASLAFAAPQGVVLNKTTGQPQPGVSLTLIKLSSGMENVGAAKSDAKGAFAFEKPLDAAVPYLLQAQFEGVTYSKAIPPGTPADNVQVDVFNSSAKPGDAKVVQHMVLLEPSAQSLGVNESIVFQNTGNKTYADPTGTFHFYLPDAAQGKVQVQVKGPGGMPVSRTAEKGKKPNEYAVNYPVRPGETTFDLAYALPPTKDFNGKLMHAGGPIRIVAPKGVKLSGDVTELGTEPRTQASIYEVKGNDYKIQIEGTGSLRAAAEAASGASEPPDDKIEEVKPRIYNKIYFVMGFAGLFLAAGFALLYRSQVSTQAARK